MFFPVRERPLAAQIFHRLGTIPDDVNWICHAYVLERFSNQKDVIFLIFYQ
jgi:hypothetical protein